MPNALISKRFTCYFPNFKISSNRIFTVFGPIGMTDIFDDRCALVSKNGTCHQCSELNEIFNPKQNAQAELLKIKMVAGSGKNKLELYKLRTQLVNGIDPLRAGGLNLHDFMMQNIRKFIEEVT